MPPTTKRTFVLETLKPLRFFDFAEIKSSTPFFTLLIVQFLAVFNAVHVLVDAVITVDAMLAPPLLVPSENVTFTLYVEPETLIEEICKMAGENGTVTILAADAVIGAPRIAMMASVGNNLGRIRRMVALHFAVIATTCSP
ncbi:unannotated protein [freshwater metagenome]|uniref:Unannotated protein n=1 Tax=freshwater metagenome TaxID=449393 RepID=A0A6J6N8M8_9ZZZZ